MIPSLQSIARRLRSSMSCHSDGPDHGVVIDIIELDTDGEICCRSNIEFDYGDSLALTAPNGQKLTLVIYDSKGRTLEGRKAP